MLSLLTLSTVASNAEAVAQLVDTVIQMDQPAHHGSFDNLKTTINNRHSTKTLFVIAFPLSMAVLKDFGNVSLNDILMQTQRPRVQPLPTLLLAEAF